MKIEITDYYVMLEVKEKQLKTVDKNELLKEFYAGEIRHQCERRTLEVL